ncbi:MAG: hypothetical protein BWY11_00157 [Firmicutes bacterium ADurb.Bin182]|nr:MAG: hypothetical protein BWY11_00157 [Firmicutes bacterium ADurb.Bin182]
MIRNEIGSEFWRRPEPRVSSATVSPDSQFHRYFISGRTALEHIIADIKVHNGEFSVALPSYCCYSMIEPFIRNGIRRLKFYDVLVGDEGFELNTELSNTDVVFIMDYFGVTSEATTGLVQQASDQGILTVLDTTQSIFCKSTDLEKVDYSFCSYRKWFYTNAAYANAKNGFISEMPIICDSNYTSARNAAAKAKEAYMSGESDSKDYLGIYHSADLALKDDYSGYTPEKTEIDYVLHIDSERIASARRENARRLIKGLSGLANDKFSIVLPQVKDCDAPLFVPIILDESERNGLRRYLISRDIYCPIHWGLTDYHNDLSDRQRNIYHTELSLICDQRYGFDSIDREIYEIVRYFREIK